VKKSVLFQIAFVVFTAMKTEPLLAQSRLPPCPDYGNYNDCFGTGAFTNGGKYVGEWKDGKGNGQGTYTYANGDKYVGQFKYGVRNGQGTFTYANGDKYVGQFKDDVRNGQGTFTYANGDKYVGQYKDDVRNGQGTFTYASGEKYVGDWKDNKRNGQGTDTYANGQKYVGQFKDDKRNGQGTYTRANGDKYEGDWKDDKRNGQGIETKANGDKYEGEWKDGVRNGQGTHFRANGDKYVGEWKDGKYNGFGKEFGANGDEVHSGYWVADTYFGKDAPPSYKPPGFRVSLVDNGGTFTVPVTINGQLTLQFVIDSGASDVFIPADVVLTLIRTGSITNTDFVGEQKYRLADGSTITSKTFRLRSLKVGEKTVENVIGSVADINGSLLLGQSFLRKFKSWSLDNSRHELVLE
jgi:hypothetical protein